ncbi:MAG TPA: ABC transporter substrate-binding protein [Arenicellales bacterium]|nr:ABC transporter substrate-binding protein [Arenicellales bacterium]
MPHNQEEIDEMRLATNSAAALGALVLFGAGFAGPVTADNLTATSWGGSYSESQRKAYYEPFMKATGHTVLEDEWGGDLAKIRAMVETNTYTTHVIDAESPDVQQGCDEGILEPIDYDALGFGPDDMAAGAGHECGVGTISWSTTLVYDKDQISGAGPANWADFWNVSKFPGKRALYKGANPNLEFALFADGVAASDMYKVLSTPEGVDRAFAKLSELKPHLIWWESGAQAPQLLADKEVSMTSAWNGRAYTAIVNDGRNFEIVWDGQVIDYDYWIVPAGHPELALAWEFIKFASSPENQGNQSKYISYGCLRKGCDAYVDPKILPHLPTAPANMKNWLKSSTNWWVDNGDDMSKRYNTWVAKD